MAPRPRARTGKDTPSSPSVAVATAASIALLLPLTGCLGWGWTLAHDVIHHHHVFKPIAIEAGDRDAGAINGSKVDVGHQLESTENP